MNKHEIREKLNTNDRWLTRGVLAIFEFQTEDEKSAEETVHTNRVGFNSYDAEFLTSIAKQLKAGRTLSKKQIHYTRRRMSKYAGQLERIAKGKQ